MLLCNLINWSKCVSKSNSWQPKYPSIFVQKFISWVDLQKVYVRKWVDIFDVFYRFWEMLQSCMEHTNTANITDSVRLLPKPLRWSVCKAAPSQGQESTGVTAIPDSSNLPPLLRFDIGGVESERTPYWKHGIPWYCWEAISSLRNLYSYSFFDIFSY